MKKMLQSKEEIERLRAEQPQQLCAYCGKKMSRLQATMVTRPREVLSQRVAGVKDGRVLYEDEGVIVQHLEGYKMEPAYHRYAPFCTLRCAETFARAAHKAGYRIKPR